MAARARWLCLVSALALTGAGSACSRARTVRPEPAVTTAARWDPKTTYAVIAGVLSWQDKGLASFPKAERKDQELYELLGARGVPKDQRRLLLDDEATTEAILASVAALAARAGKGSTFIFYYAGHGTKTTANRVVFASSDIDTSKLDATGLHVDDLVAPLRKLHGARVLLLADCCYSGGLISVAKEVAAPGPDGRDTLALTSAEASNTSTVNWTYSQMLIDVLAGRPISDLDGNGVLTLSELAAEVKLSLKCREGQRSGYASFGVEGALVLADAQKCSGCAAPTPAQPFARGSFVTAPRDGAFGPARVLAVDPAAETLSVAFYDYSHETLKTVPRASTKALEFPTHPVGTSLDVTWGGQIWEAKVLSVDEGFQLITYPGWPATWDEWITGARVVGLHAAGSPKKTVKVVKVLWGGKWWDAIVRKVEGDKTCVHYVGYGDSWDECVTAERVKE